MAQVRWRWLYQSCFCQRAWTKSCFEWLQADAQGVVILFVWHIAQGHHGNSCAAIDSIDILDAGFVGGCRCDSWQFGQRSWRACSSHFLSSSALTAQTLPLLLLTSQKIANSYPLFAWERCESKPILCGKLQSIAKRGFFKGEAGFARLLCNLAALAHHASFILFHNCGSGIWPTVMLLWFPRFVCLSPGYHPHRCIIMYHDVSPCLHIFPVLHMDISEV